MRGVFSLGGVGDRLSPYLSAGWQSGYAAACKAVDAGSIPTPASIVYSAWTKALCFTTVCPGGGIGRRSGLGWVPHGETYGCKGVKFGETLTGQADGNPELSPGDVFLPR